MTLAYQALAFLFAVYAHLAAVAAPQVSFDSYDGLGRLRILDALPDGDRTQRLHGAEFHVGVIQSWSDWAAISVADGGGKSLPLDAAIDWDRQAIVYVILAVQSNALRFDSLTVDDGGAATLQFEWIGIEPFYVDNMPVLFKVVDKDRVDSVSIRLAGHEGFGGATLGSIAIR